MKIVLLIIVAITCCSCSTHYIGDSSVDRMKYNADIYDM